MAEFRKIMTFRVNDTTPDDHVGRRGEITYKDGYLYYHDGITAGGELINGGGGGSGGPTSWASITGKPSFATVATSGSYADLANKPTIPSKTSDLTNDSDFLTTVSWADVTGKPALFDGAYASLTGKPNLFSGAYADLTGKPTIPDLTGYATEAWVNSQGFGSGGGTSYNQSLNTTDNVTFSTVITDRVENADGLRITNTYYNGTLLVGSNMTQTPVSILIGGAGPRNEWAFTPDGNLRFPDNTTFGSSVFTMPDDGEFSVSIFDSASEFTRTFKVEATSITLPTGNGIIKSGNGTWELDTANGQFTFPNFSRISYGTSNGGLGEFDLKVQAVSGGNVQLSADGRNWTFGSNGHLTLPAGGDIKDSNGNSVLGGGGGGATALSGLTDVALEGPIEGSVLTWNDSQQKWENRDIPTPSQIINSDGNSTFSVSVGTDGVISMNTARGSIEFGAMPEVGAPTHLHIMRPAGQEGSSDLYFGDDYNYVKLPSSSYSQQGVEIGSSLNQGTVSTWRFGTNGELTLPNSVVQNTTGTVVANNLTPTVIYTSTNSGVMSIKLLVQAEGEETGGQWDTQSCEIIAIKSFRANNVAASVYGLVYTSANPLATFDARYNNTTGNIEITALATQEWGVSVRVHALEITTSD